MFDGQALRIKLSKRRRCHEKFSGAVGAERANALMVEAGGAVHKALTEAPGRRLSGGESKIL